MHHVREYNNLIYFVILNSSTVTLYSVPKADLNQAATSITTLTGSLATVTSVVFDCCSWGGMAIGISTLSATQREDKIAYSTNGGVAWTTKTKLDNLTTFIQNKIAQFFFGPTSGIGMLRLLQYPDTTWYLAQNKAGDLESGSTPIFTMVDADQYYQSAYSEVIGSYRYYYIGLGSASGDAIELWSFYCNSVGFILFTLDHTISSVTIPATADKTKNFVQYNRFSKELILIDQSQMVQEYENNGIVSMRKAAATYTQHAVCYKSDNTFDYFLFDGIIYVNWGGPYRPLMALAIECAAGIADYFVDLTNDKIYGKSIGSTNLTRCEIYRSIEEERACMIISTVAFINRQAFEIYNDSDVLKIRGVITTVDNTTGQYETKLVDAALRDLQRKITYSTTVNETIEATITTIVNASCYILKIGTISTSATTRPFSCVDRPLEYILDELAHLEGLIWYYLGDGSIYINDGTTDSGVDILAADGNIPDTSALTDEFTVGMVELTVANNVKVLRTSTAESGDFISDIYTDLTEAEGIELADKILTLNSQILHGYKLKEIIIADHEPGTQITLEQNLSPNFITSAQYYIKYNYYDLINNRLVEGEYHDVLRIRMNRDKPMTSVVENLAANINQVAYNKANTANPVFTGIDAGEKATRKYIKVEDAGNFKNQYADDWGSTVGAAPSGWTDVDANLTIDASEDGHNYVMKATPTLKNGAYAEKSLNGESSIFVSGWIRWDVQAAANYNYIGLYDNGVGWCGYMRWQNGTLIVYNSAGSAQVTITGFVINTWYHFFIDYTASGVCYAYINGTLIVRWTDAGGRVTDVLWLYNDLNGGSAVNLYYDAIYCGDSWLKAWSSMYDGQVADRARWTRYGERGWHYFTWLNNGAYHTIQKATTGSAICVIRASTGAEIVDAGGILAVGAVAKSTPNAKALLIRSQCNTTVANSATEVRIYQYGKSERVQSYTLKPAPVANYNNESQGITELNVNTDFEVYLNNGASSLTTSCYLMILGYMI